MQSKIPSNEKTEQKDIPKQQAKHNESAVVVETGMDVLRQAGFDEPTARKLSSVASLDQIARQIAWLPLRNAGHNRLGMLRRAIEQNWSKPDGPEPIREVLRQRRDHDRVRSVEEAAENERRSFDKRNRARHREELKALWDGLSTEERTRIEAAAFAHQPGTVLKNLFRTTPSHRLRECLAELDRQQTDYGPSPVDGKTPQKPRP
jgi:hypothetical protein